MGRERVEVPMEKEKLDLWDRTIANGSRNKTALISFFAMNMVFVLAYFLEVIKDVRSFGSYAIVASCCIIPSILCLVIYKIKKDSMAIRYIMSFGFLLFYAYTMMTASTELVFCYVIAFFMSLIVFADFKISILLSVLAVLVNIVYIISKALSGNMQPQDITNAEIMIMSIVLTFVFALIGIVTAIRNPKSHMVAIFPIISALSGLFSTLLNPAVMISSVWIPYMIVCILMLAVAAKCLICGIIAKRKAAKAFIV